MGNHYLNVLQSPPTPTSRRRRLKRARPSELQAPGRRSATSTVTSDETCRDFRVGSTCETPRQGGIWRLDRPTRDSLCIHQFAKARGTSNTAPKMTTTITR